MPKYTPGPWYWQDLGNGLILMSSAQYKPCILTANKNGQLVTSVNGMLEPVSLENMNAALIAQAPELLSSLKDVIDNIALPDKHCTCHISPPCSDCVEHGQMRESLEKAKAVIAEAEGK